MQKMIVLAALLLSGLFVNAQGHIGKWKKVAHISSYGGTTFDSHAALLAQRPCAAKISYEINANGTYRLNAASSGCDERYRKIQEKLYAESVWTIAGNKITIGNKKTPSIGQSYIFSIKGNTMTWTGTDGQGVITWQKL